MTVIEVVKTIKGKYIYNDREFRFKIMVRCDNLGIVERIVSDIYSYLHSLNEYDDLEVTKHKIHFYEDKPIE